MRTLLISLVLLFLFTGCYNKQPKVEIVKMTETKVILPDESNYKYIDTPTLPENLTLMSMDEILSNLLTYSLKLQTTVQLYEQRTKSLIKWKSDIEEVYGIDNIEK